MRRRAGSGGAGIDEMVAPVKPNATSAATLAASGACAESIYQRVLRWIDGALALTGRRPRRLVIHQLGSAGEDVAYWFLRQRGYTIVARNYRHPLRRGEIDLIGWDGDVLAFVEVKSRAERSEYPAEQSVDQDKRRHLIGLARAYARRRGLVGRYRFDVVAIYGPSSQAPEILLHKGAFSDRRSG